MCMPVKSTGSLPLLIRRRELALKHQELAAEKGLLSSKAQKAEAAIKEGASAARDDEARVLKDHQVCFTHVCTWFISVSGEKTAYGRYSSTMTFDVGTERAARFSNSKNVQKDTHTRKPRKPSTVYIHTEDAKFGVEDNKQALSKWGEDFSK